MKRFFALVLAAVLAASPHAYAGPAIPGPAQSTSTMVGCIYSPTGVTLTAANNQAACQLDSAGNLLVAGTISASLAGFTPNGAVASLSVTTASANVALPAGTVVLVTNTGTTNIAYIKLSVGAGTAATTDMALVAGATVGLTVGTNTYINAITSSSTTTLRLAGGTGLVSGYGGGGGSGGGAVTIADAADVTLGAKADAKSTATDTTPITLMSVAKQISASAQLSATASNQTTANSSLSTVATNTGATTTALGVVTGTKNAGTAAANSALVGGVYNSTPLTLTNTQQSSLQLDANGYAKVNVAAGGAGGGAVYGPTAVGAAAANPPVLQGGTADATSTGTVQVAKVDSSGNQYVKGVGVAANDATSGVTYSPISVNAATACNAKAFTNAQQNSFDMDLKGNVCTNLASIAGTAVSTGTGAQGAGAQRVTVATDTATIAGSAPGTAGTASSNVVTVQGVASMTPILSTPAPATTGGLTFATVTAANSTNATNLKASAGQLYHLTAYNNSATLAWVSLYNTAGTPTCGTSIVYQMMIPANSTSGAGAIDDIPSGLAFPTGIGYCITTGIAGTGSVAASAYVVNFGYK